MLYKLIVAYDGTRFHGFQRQIDNAAMKARSGKEVAAMRPKKRPHYNTDSGTRKGCCVSVQEVVELLLLDMYPDTTVDEICLKFAGRTDKGVHARGQVCVVKLPLQESGWKLRKDINSRLPVDVSVQQVTCLGAECSFDPRRDVKRKQYSYTIKYRRKDSHSVAATLAGGPHSIRHAFDPPCMWVCPWSLDDSTLSTLSQQLAGTHDYSNFVHKADRNKKDQNVTVNRIDFEIIDTHEETYDYPASTDVNGDKETRTSDVVTGRFVFEAAGFRRTMLRNLVGYCVDVCRGLPGVAPIEKVFAKDADVAASINAAPAAGLCLESVTY
jgi:tRNA pseudouridine38-40 synthase